MTASTNMRCEAQRIMQKCSRISSILTCVTFLRFCFCGQNDFAHLCFLLCCTLFFVFCVLQSLAKNVFFFILLPSSSTSSSFSLFRSLIFSFCFEDAFINICYSFSAITSKLCLTHCDDHLYNKAIKQIK